MKNGMNDEPTFSIIVPIYQVEAYLEECIESILKQTYKDYEIILVDDGSMDGCGKICDEYAERIPAIQVIHKTNGGLSSARNSGLDAARGKYIYFVDSDDYIDENLLETVLNYMTEDTDFFFFWYRYVDEESSYIMDSRHMQFQQSFQGDTEKVDRTSFFYHVIFKETADGHVWDKVFRKSLIDEYHLRFADNRKIFLEDQYFTICYLAICKKVVGIDQLLYNYRIRETSLLRTAQYTAIPNKRLDLTLAVQDFIRDHQLEHTIDMGVIAYTLTSICTGGDYRSRFALLHSKDEKSKQNLAYLKQLYSNQRLKKAIGLTLEDQNILRYFVKGNYMLLRMMNRIAYKCQVK